MNEDIGWLDIFVNDSVLMQLMQNIGELHRNAHDFNQTQLALLQVLS